jgi:hypothetical protein
MKDERPPAWPGLGQPSVTSGLSALRTVRGVTPDSCASVVVLGVATTESREREELRWHWDSATCLTSTDNPMVTNYGCHN